MKIIRPLCVLGLVAAMGLAVLAQGPPGPPGRGGPPGPPGVAGGRGGGPKNVQALGTAPIPETLQLCLPKSPFLLRQLMLQPTMDTLLGDDVGACLAPADLPLMGAFARRAPARVAGLAPPTERSAALAASAIAARAGGPLALGRALACAD